MKAPVRNRRIPPQQQELPNRRTLRRGRPSRVLPVWRARFRLKWSLGDGNLWHVGAHLKRGYRAKMNRRLQRCEIKRIQAENLGRATNPCACAPACRHLRVPILAPFLLPPSPRWSRQPLLRPQRLGRIHRSRPPRRKVARQQRRNRQHHRHANQRPRIPRLDPEQQLAHQHGRSH